MTLGSDGIAAAISVMEIMAAGIQTNSKEVIDENVSLRTAPHTAIVEPPLTERIIVSKTSPPRVSMRATYS